MLEMTPFFVVFIAFAVVAGGVVVVGRLLSNQASMQRRLPVPALAAGGPRRNVQGSGFLSSLANRIDEKKFGVNSVLRTKLRRELVRAGYFSDESIRLYVLARIGLVLALPILTYVFCVIFLDRFAYADVVLVAISAVVAIIGPDAFIARTQRHLQQQYRIIFPDLLDMLVVCIEAGLSLEASFGRIRPEAAKRSRALGANLAMLGAETRAGRSTADALDSFADRVNLDEVRAFVTALRQSLELGMDVGDALRTFSDEMRDKRLLRAEETANKLPVKMVVPIGVFIFPVILLVMMLPVAIRFLSVIAAGG
jgi:tight adherence protein C